MNNCSCGKHIINGAIAGLIAGAIYFIFLLEHNMLSTYSMMFGSVSPSFGAFIHIILSIIVGGIFGLLFGSACSDYTKGILFGAAFGIVVWAVGPMTLLPYFAFKTHMWQMWEQQLFMGMLPSVVWHIIFGVLLGSFFVRFRGTGRIILEEVSVIDMHASTSPEAGSQVHKSN